jgi:hypothetical protein
VAAGRWRVSTLTPHGVLVKCGRAAGAAAAVLCGTLHGMQD